MKTIDLVYFNAGGGHRAAAMALDTVIREQQRPWQVRCINLVEVLDPRGLFRKHMGFEPEAFYNQRLRRGWTLGLAQELKLLQGMIRLYHGTMVRRLQEHWAQTEPDLVVSLVPNFNRALAESVAGALPGVPFVTVMTDLADLPPHFWIEPGQRQYLVCGSARAVAQARAQGVPDERVARTSGMILRPDFHRAAPVDRHAELRALGLDPARPTGIVMFGGQGSMQMVSIARALQGTQLILLCGHNDLLAKRLKALATTAPPQAARARVRLVSESVSATASEPRAAHAVVGHTTDICRWMQLGDFFIGKPGPGSLSEAVHMGLPVLTFDNAWTMPQERYNARWVRELGLGLVLTSTRSLRHATRQLIERLPEFQNRVRAVDNRAVFEVVDLLAEHLARSQRLDPALLSSLGTTS